MNEEQPYDALLVVSFGGPEGPDDVMPFLENVLRGKNVPRERMLEVAEHYQHFGGVSPINQQCRALISALTDEFAEHGLDLPIYWGNRNWHPMLADTLGQMRKDGIQRALALMTSAFSSYSGCRQYREDVLRAQQEVGRGAPQVDKLRLFFNHPGFIDAVGDRVQAAINRIPADRRSTTQIIFTAHSIPLTMAAGCAYEAQLNEACRLVMESFSEQSWRLVYQSRSGPPTQPWLEPDVCDYLREVHQQGGITDVVIAPIGFLSDHMEVLFDLDTEARVLCDEVGLNMVRAGTVGTHPKFIQMIRELVLERTSNAKRLCLGEMGPSHDVCPEDCCLSGRTAGRPGGGPPG
jgi:ferrochelatase